MTVALEAFDSREAASHAAAGLLAGSLRRDLDRGSPASLVLSGGTSPGRCYELLSRADLDWRRVRLLPSDERWVPPDDPASNEHLVRCSLMQGRAAEADFLPLYRAGLDPDQAPAAVERDLEALADPFSAVLLGMGADGHFASLFPDFDGLRQALDPAGAERCVVVRTAGSPFVRISLTLAALLRTRETVLLFFGEDKRAVFEAAAAGDGRYPVSALLAQDGENITALWAP